MKNILTTSVLILLPLLSACGSITNTSDFEDTGNATVHPEDEEYHSDKPLESGTPLNVTVVFSDCISACAETEKADCSVSIDGNEISIEASARINTDEEQVCIALCGVLTATCELGALDPGEYKIKYGEGSADFSLPNENYVNVDSGRK